MAGSTALRDALVQQAENIASSRHVVWEAHRVHGYRNVELNSSFSLSH